MALKYISSRAFSAKGWFFRRVTGGGWFSREFEIVSGVVPTTETINSWSDTEDWIDDDDDGWISSLIAAAFVPEIIAFQAIDDDDAEDEPDQLAQLTPGLNDFVQSFTDQQDDDEDEFADQFLAQIDAPVVAQVDFVTAWHEAEDADDDEDLWQPWYLDTPASVVQEFAIGGFFDVDEDDDDDADSVFSQIIDSVAAADDFIQGLFDVDEDLLEDDDDFGQTQAISEDIPVPVVDDSVLFDGHDRFNSEFIKCQNQALLCILIEIAVSGALE